MNQIIDQLRQTRHLKINASIEQIKLFFQELSIQEHQNQQKQKTLISLLVFSIFGGIIGIVISHQNSLFGSTILIVSLIAIAYAIFRLYQFRSLSLPTRKADLCQRFLDLLYRDLNPDEPVNLQVLFDSPTDSSKKVATLKNTPRSGWATDIFEDQWFHFQGKLADGTQLLLALTTKSVMKAGYKTGTSGKRKFKSKTKSKGEEIKLILNYPLRRYGAIQVLKPEIIHAIKIPEKMQIKNLRVTDKSLQLIVKSDYEFTDSTYKTVTMMLLSCYQVLNLAHQLSKTKR